MATADEVMIFDLTCRVIQYDTAIIHQPDSGREDFKRITKPGMQSYAAACTGTTYRRMLPEVSPACRPSGGWPEKRLCFDRCTRPQQALRKRPKPKLRLSWVLAYS